MHLFSSNRVLGNCVMVFCLIDRKNREQPALEKRFETRAVWLISDSKLMRNAEHGPFQKSKISIRRICKHTMQPVFILLSTGSAEIL